MSRSYLVVGSGLIGTSIAIALVAGGDTVFVTDIDAAAQSAAQEKSGAQPWDGEIQVDVVFVATPPNSTAAAMRAMVVAQPSAVITDVTSVKESVFAQLSDLDIDDQRRIVGSHPMAGREVSGARGAVSNLFVDRPWVITRGPNTGEVAVDAVRAAVASLGAVPVERTLVDHDRAVALVSHAPQVVASVLAAQLVPAPAQDVELAGQGLRDTVRIASSDPSLWVQILAANGTQVAQQVEAVAGELHAAAQAIRSGDEAAIAAVLERGVAGHARLPGKHGSARSEVAALVVRVEDRPGELARLFSVAAQSGVNLEDVRIDHTQGRMTGLVELAVGPGAVQVLSSALESAGFRVAG